MHIGRYICSWTRGRPVPEFQPGPSLVEKKFAGAGFWNLKMPGPSPAFLAGAGFCTEFINYNALPRDIINVNADLYTIMYLKISSK